MKTLYVSDLDGTLLTPDKQVSERSVSILNGLIGQGVLFTVATARSASTAAEMMAPLNLTLPGVLLNGALLYDFVQKKYIDCAKISPRAVQQALEVFHGFNRPPFLYLLEDNRICVEFERLAGEEERRFYNERKNKDYKRFQQVQRLQAGAGDSVIYFTMMDSMERLSPLHEQLQRIDGIRTAFYRDNYSDVYYLEVFSSDASKSAGIQKVKRVCGAERLVVFGDNMNDLDMLHMADTGLAVADARPQVLAAADAVIGSSYEDGVARYILNCESNAF